MNFDRLLLAFALLLPACPTNEGPAGPPVGVGGPSVVNAWSRSYGGERADVARVMVEAANGDYLVAGSSDSYSDGLTDAWLTRTDAVGNPRWSVACGANDLRMDAVVDIVETSDGGFLVVGDGPDAGGALDAAVARIDASGAFSWRRSFGEPGSDERGRSVVEAGGSVFVAVTAGGSIRVVRLDSAGTTIWDRSVIGGTPDVGIFASGYGTLFVANREFGGVLEIDFDGNGIGSDVGGFVLVLSVIRGPEFVPLAGADVVTSIPGFDIVFTGTPLPGGRSVVAARAVVFAAGAPFQIVLDDPGAPAVDYRWIAPTQAGGFVTVAETPGGQIQVELCHFPEDRADLSDVVDFRTILATEARPLRIEEKPGGGFVILAERRVGGQVLLHLDADATLLALRDYGGEAEIPYAGRHTDDGGYVIAGSDLPANGGTQGGWVLRVAADRSTAWERLPLRGSSDVVHAGLETFFADGTPKGFLLAGSSDAQGGGDRDLWLLSVNGDGSVRWNRTLGGGFDDAAFALAPGASGGHVVAGQITPVGGDADAWVVEVDTSGAVVRHRSYDLGGAESVRSIRPTDDDGDGVADDGYVAVAQAGGDAWILKLDAQLDVQWQRRLGGPGTEVPVSVVVTYGDGPAERGFAVGGTTDSGGAGAKDFWVVQPDGAGNLVWAHSYGGPEDEECAGLRGADDDGLGQRDDGFILGGTTRSFGGGQACDDGICTNAWLLKLSTDGAIAWQRSYSTATTDLVRAVDQGRDGGFFLAGATDSVALDLDYWVIKTKADGQIASTCEDLGVITDGERNAAAVQVQTPPMSSATPSYAARQPLLPERETTEPRIARFCIELDPDAIDGRIAYIHDVAEDRDIYTMNADGTGVVRVTSDDEWKVRPVWSPDRQQIAFLKYRGEEYQLFVVDAEGTNERQVTDLSGDDSIIDFDWSPDGSEIALAIYGSSSEIRIIDLQGNVTATLAEGSDFIGGVSWAPQGGRIAYTTGSDLYVVGLGGGAPDLAYDGDSAHDPAWGPDDRILFSSDDFETGDTIYPRLFTISPRGDRLERVNVVREGPLTSGSWSSDGSRIVYVTSDEEYEGRRLHVTRADGTDPGGEIPGQTDSNVDPDW